MFNSNDRKKADTFLKDNGYSNLKNSNGYSNGNTIVKSSCSGGSYNTNNGKTYTDLSSLKNGLKK